MGHEGVGVGGGSVGEARRAQQVVRDGGRGRVLGVSLRGQRPHDHLPGLQTLDPVELHGHVVRGGEQDLGDLRPEKERALK